MKNKKAVINQIFVYIMSTIAIVFVGYLVTKFIVAFTSDSQAVIEDKFLNGLDNDIKQVASRYGSEEIADYKINSQVTNICFLSTPSCASNLVSSNELPIEQVELNTLAENSNVLFFDKNGISKETSINQFNSDQENGCYCIKPNNGRFSLLIENRQNKVWISQYE